MGSVQINILMQTDMLWTNSYICQPEYNHVGVPGQACGIEILMTQTKISLLVGASK